MLGETPLNPVLLLRQRHTEVSFVNALDARGLDGSQDAGHQEAQKQQMGNLVDLQQTDIGSERAEHVLRQCMDVHAAFRKRSGCRSQLLGEIS